MQPVCFGNTVYAAPQGSAQPRKLVMLESPFANPDSAVMQENVAYAQQAMMDSMFFHGEAPMASHLLYTQVTNEDDPAQRAMGIQAGLAWRTATAGSVVYTDRGSSRGVAYGIAAAQESGKPVEYRSLKTCGHDKQVKQLYQALSARKTGLQAGIMA